MIYPGHGAGSLCGRAIGSVRSSTLGFEKRHNPALAITDRNEFVDYMTNNLPEQPGNHQRIKAINRAGQAARGDPGKRPLASGSNSIFPARGGAARYALERRLCRGLRTGLGAS